MKYAYVLVAFTLCSLSLAQSTSPKEEEKRFKEQEKIERKERKNRERSAAISGPPSIVVRAPADKLKAAVLARIGQWGGFTLVGDSSLQLKFQRNVRWPSVWNALALESTSSRPTKEGLTLTFVESEGKTSISSDRSVTRESDYGRTQTDTVNNIGKWNLELQSFLDDVKVDLEKSLTHNAADSK